MHVEVVLDILEKVEVINVGYFIVFCNCFLKLNANNKIMDEVNRY